MNNLYRNFTKCLIVIFFIILGFQAAAQKPSRAGSPAGKRSWFELMQDPDSRFQDVQKAFYKYWEKRLKIKEKEAEETGETEEEGTEESEGEGYQVFKRWEYINKHRVLPDGRLQAPGYVKSVYDKYMAELDATSSAAGNWVSLGPTAYVGNTSGQPTGMGRLNAIAFHPTDANTIYVGAPSGGFWKTTSLNGNSTVWTNLSNNLPTLGVSSILVHPSNPNIIYLGTGDRDAANAPGIGVYKSTDGGATWSQVSAGMGNVTVGAMVMLPSDPNTILAATSAGIYKTTNGGTSWSQKQSGDFKDIKFKPGDPTVVYAARSITPAEFYRSTNTGDAWTKNTSLPSGTGSRSVIGVSPADPSYVYLVLTKSDNTFLSLYRSTDYGVNFTAMAASPPNILSSNCDGTGTTTQATYDLCIAVDPSNINTVYVGGVDIWKSTDGGATWAIKAIWAGTCSGTAFPVHADHHVFEWSPLDGRLYNGNDGGLYYTANGGTTFTELTGGLAITQVYKFGQGVSNVNYCIFGCQDNGCGATMTGTSFTTVSGGDGGECEIDYANTNYCYDTYVSGSIRRSTTGPMGSYSQIGGNGVNGIDESADWIMPYALHHTVHTTLFAGYKNMWRSTNITSSPPTWVKISSGETVNCEVIEQSPVNLDLLYAVRSGSMKRTENANDAAGSVTWTSCTLPGGGTPTDLVAHPTDANTVYATVNYGVYKSTDKGATWTNITGNLPGLFINCLAYDKTTNEGLYVGNQTGVWYKDATMSNWMLFSNGLPPADVRELEIYYDANPSNNRIKAGTFGRGMWQSDMAAVTVIDPTAFSAYAANSAQINLGWTKNAANDNVLIAVSSTGTFGQPEDGTAYSAGNALPAGGTVLYNGSASGYNHTGLSVNTKYYYKAWSVNGSAQYSAGLAPISATTDCQALNSFPYICTFDNTDCWQVIDNTGNGSWLFGSTSNSSNPPTLLTSPYAYFMSSPGSPVNYNSDLISPPFDFSSHGTVVLKFNQHYDGDAVWSSIARVYYTADNGLNWNLLATYTTDQNNIPVAILVPGAAGQSNVKFKWNYFDDATGSYFWGIDDVQVVECSGVWTGSVSTNWHTAGNWCNNSVPTTTTDVYIPAGVTNFPDISTSATAYCRDITIQSGATLKMSAANSVLEVKGNWTMHGSFDFTYSSTSAMVKFNGSSPQSVGGSTYTKLRGFTIDNTSGVTTSIELRADNAIQLINGIVTTTGSGKVYDVYSVIVRTNGWVNGTLQKYLWTGNTSVENRTFQIGDATRYAPVALSFPISSITATGPISMKTTAGDHTSIGASTLDGSLSVNRYWSFPSTGTFTSCTATFNFVNDDLDAGTLTGNLNAGMYKSGSWTYPTVGTRTSTSIQITGFASTNLTDIQLAETVPSITWGNLQWPANGNIALGGTFNVYGQVYLGGVTPGAGAGAGMQSWVGYSTSNTDPSGWTNWVPATYNVDNGNNDEYMANLGASITAPGTWYYAMRYKRGSSSYVYGGYSAGGGGLWDGSTYVSGVLTVTGPTFTGTGNWTDAARWSTGAVPASTVSTIIDGTCTISSAVTTADLTINSGRSVIVASNGQFTVNGLLTNNAGTTGLVIKSDVTGTGSLIHSTGGVPGTAERYIANDWKWHFLASPVLAQPVWTEFSPAPTGTPLSFGSSSWNWDFYYWNPNADTSTGLYWVNLRKENGDYNDGTIDETGNNAGFGTSTPPVMTPGRGYLAAYNTGWTTGSPVTHQFSGSLNEGSISCPVSINSNKFNLAGNPYPSAVDWQATGGWSRTNLALNGSGYDYWIYNDNAGNYGVFNSSTGSGTNGTSRYIASGQAFFVKATSAGSLGMTDAVRVHSTQAWLKNTDEDPSAVRLQLTSTANAYSDEMIVAFNPAFVPGGSEKLRSFYDEAPEIWSVSGSREYSIVRYTQPSDELVVPVSIKAGVTAGFTITSPGVTGFGLSSRVYLEDLKTGMTQDLKSNPVYSFSASPGDVPERFRLHFGAPFGIGNEDNRSCLAIWITGKKIRIKSENGCMSDGELSIFNILGQEMIHQRLSGTETTVPMDERPGYYIVKVVTDRQTIVRKVFIPM